MWWFWLCLSLLDSVSLEEKIFAIFYLLNKGYMNKQRTIITFPLKYKTKDIFWKYIKSMNKSNEK